MPHVLRNFDALATSPLRADALAIAEAGYRAVDTRLAVSRKLLLDGDALCIGDARFPLAGRRVFFVGIGKCAIAAAETVETLLGERLTGGIAFDVSPIEGCELKKIEIFIGTHPEPSDVNMRATEHIVAFLAERREDDLVLALVSGGGSTLLCLHDAPMTCLDEHVLFDEFTARGATIQELNTVRKHLSLARGGGLAKAAYPAEVLALVVSDVPGNDLEFIASGPTVQDTSTVADAKEVLARYGIEPPEGIRMSETPKETRYFERVTNVLFVTNEDALEAMRAEAEARGYATTIVDDRFKGEAREVGQAMLERLHAAHAKSALLSAGESTVAFESEKRGKGGRNQEMALAALEKLAEGELLLPFASDGRDNSDHAGAIADETTRAHAAARNLSADDALAGHASYDFFAATGDALMTGYTGSNVSDLLIALKR
ncbi:MAG TPA: DUF4147 domain-containing protein [Candidatus Paceibacterota bacterium]|nr:DUF4147 domain-containing protein [Candidatus Paceibacterota bacterium]